MSSSKRKVIEIDDIVQLVDIPTPLIIEEQGKSKIIRGLCPFCGEELSHITKYEDDKMHVMLAHLMQDVIPILAEHYKDGCNEPKVDFIIKEVKVNYSFEGLQETFSNFDIKLTKKDTPSLDIKRI